jgi:hypothetical protein
MSKDKTLLHSKDIDEHGGNEEEDINNDKQDDDDEDHHHHDLRHHLRGGRDKDKAGEGRDADGVC